MEVFFAHKDAYPALALVGVAISIAAIFVARFWFEGKRSEMELALKQSMVERGMNAAEICAVIEARTGGKREIDEESQSPAYSSVRT
jgi:hypothetical protein